MKHYIDKQEKVTERSNNSLSKLLFFFFFYYLKPDLGLGRIFKFTGVTLLLSISELFVYHLGHNFPQNFIRELLSFSLHSPLFSFFSFSPHNQFSPWINLTPTGKNSKAEEMKISNEKRFRSACTGSVVLG